MMRVAILISGRGSNMLRLADADGSGSLSSEELTAALGRRLNAWLRLVE